jgi:hypothetical protein
MRKRTSIIGASFWMLVVSGLLCWLPFVGPAIGGVVGGQKAGTIGRAITATFLPVIVIAILAFVFTDAITGMPILGTIAAMGVPALMTAAFGPMLLGSIIGAILA